MKDLFARTKQLAVYIIENQTTIRQTAKVFGLSKSTVHNDLSKRLRFVDGALYVQVRYILDKNFQEKSIRGGIATQKKYIKQKKNWDNILVFLLV